MILKKLLLAIILFSSSIYANTCPKWLPLSTGDIFIVIPIYDESITGPDMDCDGILDSVDTDIDGDGVSNTLDAFPTNGSESLDTDGDGIGNNADLDDDNDGVSDNDEILNGTNPLNPDTDGDGVNDKDDFYPNDNTRSVQVVVFQAQDDNITVTSIVETTVDVLVNDSITDGSTGSILLENYGINGIEYVSQVVGYEGTWTVTNNQVIFTPNANFLGGTVLHGYQLSDASGNTKFAIVYIHFPIIMQAQYDNFIVTSIAETTVDVLANDTITDGSLGTILLENYGINGVEYITHVVRSEGNWTVVNNQIVFTPSANFSGGYTGIGYQLSDASGHVQTTWVDIEFPIIMQAYYDGVIATNIIETTVDVLANDIITDGSTGTVLLVNWGINGEEYLSSVSRSEGNWTVVNNQVVFTPNANFAGGFTGIGYQLSDASGHKSNAGVDIEFPIIIQAQYDNVIAPSIVETTVDVLANDIITDGSTGTVLLVNWGINGEEYLSSVSRSEGNWTVVNNQIVFTPNSTFTGGWASMEYQLSDASGHTQTTWVSIEFPVIIQAQYDTVVANSIIETTVDVLANDTITDGSLGTVLLENWGINGLEYNTSVSRSDGNWTVVNNQVIFTPAQDFLGGWVYMTYQLSDASGNSHTTGIQIQFPIIIQAQYDNIVATSIVETTIDVLANDTITDGSLGTVLLENYGINGLEYNTTVSRSEGNWTVVNNQVIFTPSLDFIGGWVYMTYQLTDASGHTQTTWINIEFPVIIQAQYDSVIATSILETTVDVLANDTITDGSLGTVLLENWGINGLEYNTTVSNSEGNWTVVNNQVIFTPAPDFLGGWVYMTYQLSDASGHTHTTGVQIQFPVIIQAQYDNVIATSIAETTVDVLANDTITDGSLGTVLLKNWGINGLEYNTTVSNSEGTWTVFNNQVIFTPSLDFIGGWVYMTYQLSDASGHTQNASIYIEFPVILQAQYDNVIATSIIETTVDVLANDTITDGSLGTVLLENWDINGTIYTTSVSRSEGNWTVINDQVIFTPAPNYLGGWVYMTYQLSDASGHTHTTGVQIQFPFIIQAQYDNVVANSIIETTVDVLANDTITDGSLGTVLLENWDINGSIYSTSVSRSEGNWTVINDQVIFTPSLNFLGGWVNISYQLSDASGHTQTAWVSIEFPVILQAQYDSVIATSIVETTVDVLANDTITDGSLGTVLLENYNYISNSYEYLTAVETFDGNWTVVAEQVIFTPGVNFIGGPVYQNYQLSDLSGHTQITSISIQF